MKSFTAIFNHSDYCRIITVGAENEAEACKEVRRQLSRPGRYNHLSAWERDGEEVIERNQYSIDK
jgi:hypothetical protein